MFMHFFLSKSPVIIVQLTVYVHNIAKNMPITTFLFPIIHVKKTLPELPLAAQMEVRGN